MKIGFSGKFTLICWNNQIIIYKKSKFGSSRNSGAWNLGKVLNLQDENRRYNMDVPS